VLSFPDKIFNAISKNWAALCPDRCDKHLGAKRYFTMKTLRHLLPLVLFLLLGLTRADAGQLTGGPILVERNTVPSSLASALVTGGNSGLTIRQASLQGHSTEFAASTGLYYLGSEGVNNGYGLTMPGIVLSTGNVTDYQSGPNTSGNRTTGYETAATGDQETLLDPITGSATANFNHFDVTQLDIDFDVTADKNFISFYVVFGSEEYAEYVNSQYIDGFGIYLNGQNIALASGKPVNINHPEMSSIAGTELDGVLSPQGSVIMQFTALVAPGSVNNKLTFIVADTSDDALDTTVYIFSLGSAVPPPPLTISNSSVVEGNDGTRNMVFQVELSEAEVGLQTEVGTTIQVSYSTVDGTATAGVDYTASSGLLTFPPGTTTRQILVPILGDTVTEPDETILIRLTNPIGASFAGPPATGTIINDDADAVMTVFASVSDVTVTEGNSGTVNAVFTVMLSCPSASVVKVNYRTVNGSATQGTDFVAVNGILEFEPGELQRTVCVLVNGDLLNEAVEKFSLVLSNPVNAVLGDDRGMGTILNDDPVTTKINIFDVTVAESNSGTATASFQVCLTEVSGQAVTAKFTTVNGTALSGSDYVAATSGVTIPAGQLNQTVNITVKSDALVEPNENFQVQLSNPVNATIMDGQATGTITDNPRPVVSIQQTSVTEGNEGHTIAQFQVTLAAPSTLGVVISYATADGTAKVADNDYEQTSGLLFFAPGETTKTIEVCVNGDLINEANETFFVNLSNEVKAYLATPTEYEFGPGVLLVNKATGTIVNDDPVTTQLYIDSVTVLEPSAGSVKAIFNVCLSEPSGQTVTVRFATANVTALAGSDYAAVSGFVSFPPGVTSRTVVVTVNGDTVLENAETFVVNLSMPVNATIENAVGTGTILNATDENSPTLLSIADVSVNEGNSGITHMTFTVTMPFASLHTVTANFVTASGSAKSGTDFISASGTVIFTPGSTSQTITIHVLGDVVNELNETLSVTLSSPVNASLLRNRATGTIVNDDPLPKITIHDTSIVEGDSGTRYMEFELSLSGTSSRTISVNFATADGSALAPGSYAARNGILVFPAGTSTQCVAVVVCGNATIETDKYMRMLLSVPVNATILDGEGIGTIVNDDGLPGHLNHFTWSAIPFQQTVNHPFPVTITARDRFGDVVTTYSGIVNLTASAASPDAGLHNILGAPVHQSLAGGLRSAGYDFTPNQRLLVTHVRHYSGTKVSIWKSNGQLLASKNVTSTPGSWQETELDTPLVLEAGTTYRVGVLSSGYYTRTTTLTAFAHGTVGGGFQTPGDFFPSTALQRLPFVDLRYAIYGNSAPVAVNPTQSGVFENGVWSGNVSLPATADLVTLRADDGFNHAGSSGSFEVLAGHGLVMAFNSGASGLGGLQLLSAGATAGSVQLFFTPGQGYVIEISSDLTNWTPVFTNASGRAGSYFSEPAGEGTRFYRAKMLP
jgi:hypothetical protein